MTNEITTAERIRQYLKQHGPQTTQQLMAALGMKFAQVWGHCRPQVDRGCLAYDPDKGYSYVRDARPISERRSGMTQEERSARERDRSRRRCEQRKAYRQAERAARGLIGPVVRAQRQAECRNKAEERAQAAQAMRNRENGTKPIMPAPPKVETVAEWMARTGKCPQVLRDGDVSAASRFQRLEVRA